ncbi:hypothetical protein LTS12_018417 [Elasticomyces elasticus]|nr:hypothetical protein LTS12_018417 [Elasticomyces elasticus]
MAAPPKKLGLSLYANLLDISKPDSATATISSAPVRYDNAKQGGATDEAQKRKDAALQFQPVRRPVGNSKKDGAKKVGGKGGHMFSSSTTSASVVDSSAVGSTPSVQRSNFEDWVGDEDEDSFFLENRDKPKPERGGRKNKKKKGGKGQEVVATRSWSWDDVYDPSMPNNYADYKGSEEQVMEIRDWKARLYYHRVKGGKKNGSGREEETVKKAAANSMFAPPASLNFAPPSFDQTPTKPAPPQQDDDDEYYPPSVPSRLPDTSDSYEPPPAFSTPARSTATDPRTQPSFDPRRAAMPPPPPPPAPTPVLPTPPVLSADAAEAIATKKAEAAAKIAAFKAKVEAHKAAKAAAENGGAAVPAVSEVPAALALPVAQPAMSEPVHVLPPPPLPPPAAEELEPGAIIFRAPVHYIAPPAPSDNTPTTAADVEAEADEETRSNRPGQKGFAERLLKKYGWEKGKGLGAQGNEGITTAIVAKAEKRKKLADAEGGGWAKPANMGKLVGGKRRKVDGGEGGDGEGEMSSVVRLSNMLTGLDVEVEIGEKDLYGEIGREMEGEYGKVERVFIYGGRAVGMRVGMRCLSSL